MSAPAFLETSAAVIVAEMLAQAETALDRTIYPGQPENLLIGTMAYRESLVRLAIQDAAEQCLVEYARGAHLDALGANLGVTRLPAAAATTTWRITLPEPRAELTVFDSGWGAVSASGKVFRLVEAVYIAPGDLVADATAVAEQLGVAGNDLPPGAWSPLEGTVTVGSLAITSGGTEPETDAALRARILDAPTAFTTAGSVGAYRYHAKSAHPAITDVAVASTVPGIVDIYVLAEGTPSEPILQAVRDVLESEAIRPICETVQVFPPDEAPFTVTATLTLYRDADRATVLAAAQSALDAWVATREAALGRDLVGSQLIAALSIPGVYRVVLTDWMDQELGPHQWATCSASSLTIAVERADG